MTEPTRNICVTEEDLARLRLVIEARRGQQGRDRNHLEALEEELERAEVVEPDELPPDVVTMRSRVRVHDLVSGDDAVYTLVFPREADVAQGRLSVLAPIGTALLGYRAGDVIEWPVPGGVRTLQIAEVLYQPEAAATDPARAKDAAHGKDAAGAKDTARGGQVMPLKSAEG